MNWRRTFADESLVKLCISGDASAWEELTSILREMALKRLSGRPLWTAQDVEDLMQQMNMALLADDFRILRSYDARRARLRTYLSGVLEREIKHYARRHFRHPQISLENLPIEADEQWEEALARIDVWEQIQQALSFTDVLILRFTAEGYRAREIADILSRGMGRLITEANVRQRRKRAYQRLKKRFGAKFLA